MKLGQKTINYRGGVVRFCIPSNWIDEYEPEGGGTFYEDRPDSGTLRLNVLEFESPTNVSEDLARDAIQGHPRQALQSGFTIQVLPSGFTMRRYVWPAVEEGEALNIHRWEVAVPVPPHCLRLVIFAHTIVAGQEDDPRIATELQMIEDSVTTAAFSQSTGVKGSYYHDTNA